MIKFLAPILLILLSPFTGKITGFIGFMLLGIILNQPKEETDKTFLA